MTKIQQQVCQLLGSGMFVSEIVALENIHVTREEIYRWQAEDREFAAEIRLARQRAADLCDEQIAEIAETVTAANAHAARVQLEALRWRAARLYPRKYGTGFDDEVSEVPAENVIVKITLPDNGRDPGLSGISEEERAAWRKDREEAVKRFDGLARRLIAQGEATERGALEFRRDRFGTDVAAWVPMPKVEAPRLPYFPKGNGEVESTPEAAPREVVMLVKMYGRAKATYTLKSGREYTADWAGQVVARSDDEVELRLQGLRVG